jgi:hypothetical protein
MLRDDPELVRLAERVAALGEEPSEATVERQRRLLVSGAAAAVVGAAVVAVVVVLLAGSRAPGLSDRAFAAIGGDRVLHVVVTQTVGDDRTLDLATGRQTPARLEVESWFDEQSGRLHVLQRRNGGLIDDTLETRQAAARGTSPRLDPALALFLTGYRQALRQGQVRAAGAATVDGHHVRWLALVHVHPAGERIAVDGHTFLPVLIQEHDGTRWSVTRIESMSVATADFRTPRLRPPALSGGSVTAQQPSSPSRIVDVLGVPPLWLGRHHSGYRLTALRLQRLASVFPRTAHLAPVQSVGVSLSYRSGTGTAVELREAGRPLPAYSFSGGLTFAFDPIPPEGSMQLSSIGGGWIGQLRTRGLYVTITGPDPATVIRAVRELQPISR